MSKIRYNAVMSSDAGPTIAARFILSILADRAKDDGYSYPGPEWLARQAKCDITTVRRAIKALNEGLFGNSRGREFLRGPVSVSTATYYVRDE